jgi:hypothetical protein
VRARRRLTLVVLLAGLALVVAWLLTLSSPSPAREFGADFGVIFQSHYPPAVVSRAMASARASGLELARVAPLWEFTEPLPPRQGRHRYDWRYDDYIARQLAGHGLRWVAVLGFAPGWASVNPDVLHSAPRGTANYAAYAAAVARRYGGLIAAFEVWNEENTSAFWRPAPSAVAYARLYEAARSAIHRVDPGTPVLVGGLADGHRRFLASLLRQPELRGGVDGIAIHPYAATPAGVLATVEGYRRRLTTFGFGPVPLYVTEYGWSSRPILSPAFSPSAQSPSYAPASIRPRFIVQAARDVLSSGCNVRMAIFYAWLTQQSTPASPYQWFGVAAPNGAATPATRDIGRQAGALARGRAVSAGSCSASG